MRSLKIVYEWEKGRDLLCCWLQTVYLALVLSQPGSYTSVQKVSGSRSCRSCAERSGGLCRAWHLPWHVSPWALLGVVARSQLCFWSKRRYPREQSCFMLWRQIPAAPEKAEAAVSIWQWYFAGRWRSRKRTKFCASVQTLGQEKMGAEWREREGKHCRHRTGNFSGWMFLSSFSLVLIWSSPIMSILFIPSFIIVISREHKNRILLENCYLNFFIPNS